MSTNKKLIKLFATSLNISETIVNDNLKYNEIEEWDSNRTYEPNVSNRR